MSSRHILKSPSSLYGNNSIQNREFDLWEVFISFRTEYHSTSVFPFLHKYEISIDVLKQRLRSPLLTVILSETETAIAKPAIINLYTPEGVIIQPNQKF